MFESIYTGLTGLLGFSKGLDIISNNVANLNTPGFKSSQLQFQDLFYQYRMDGNNESAAQLGTGVGTGGTSLKFTAGEMRETGNDNDVAIDGNGFFILRKDGQTFYTRVGQFDFDENGFLIARADKQRVAGLTGGNSLHDVNISGFRINPPTPTTEIKFVDNLASGTPQGTTHEVDNVTVYDSLGKQHTLKIIFTSNDPTLRSWFVGVTDETNATLLTNGEIRFSGDGSPAANFNTLSFSYAPSGALANTITLNFGDPGSISGATGLSGTGSGTDQSTLKVASQNGIAIGSLTKISFDPDGYLVATYSNGQTAKPDRLALAWFDHLQALQETGGNLFVNKTDQQVRLAAPGEDVMGKLNGKNIELSNVELTQQFTDMIIIQRGYQGSSQVISAANEMLQDLLDLKKR